MADAPITGLANNNTINDADLVAIVDVAGTPVTEKRTIAELGDHVVDTTRVTAAGALMDSELTSIADVKALDQSVVSGAAPVFDATNMTNIPAGTVDVVSNVATARLLGRTTAGSGDSEELTAAAAKTLLAITESDISDLGTYSTATGVEDNADVTDTTNVTAAGALMDSELTSITDVKALDQSVVSGATPTFTTTNMTDATNKRFMSDAQETVLNNTSGTNTGDEAAASTTVAGVVELATTTETNTGTDTTRAVTPDGLADSKFGTSSLVSSIQFVIDGGGSAITTGVKGYIEVPFACTINQVTLLADQSGSIVVDIWKDSYANYPPTDADSITASAVPTISTATKSQDATLTGWTTSISAGDILGFNVDSITTCTRVTLSSKVTRT